MLSPCQVLWHFQRKLHSPVGYAVNDTHVVMLYGLIGADVSSRLGCCDQSL